MTFFIPYLIIIVCYELLTRFNIVKDIRNYIDILKKIPKTLKQKSYSDEMKFKFMIQNSAELMFLSIYFLMKIIFIIFPLIVLMSLDYFFGSNFSKFIYDIFFYIIALLVLFIYIRLKKMIYDWEL